jgi:hypothetical protein
MRGSPHAHMVGTQAAGREEELIYAVPRLPHPGPRCAHTEETGRSLVQRPHHLTTCRSEVSLCVSAPVFLWLITKGHAKLLHCCCTPTRQAPLAFAFTCMAVGWQASTSSHPRRLHAHAAHRVPTARTDRPPCRPDTGMRGVYPHANSLFLILGSHVADQTTMSTQHESSPPEVAVRVNLSVPVSRREELLVPTPGDGRPHHSTAPAFCEIPHSAPPLSFD